MRTARIGTNKKPAGRLAGVSPLKEKMVPPVRLERTRPCGQQILSLPRLPVPPRGPETPRDYRDRGRRVNGAIQRSHGRFSLHIYRLRDIASSMLRALYDWTMRLAAGRHAEPALAGVSFVESSVFPIPPDALLAPMILARRERTLRYWIVCTLASVAGGLFGYLIGAFLFEQVAQPILAFYGYADKFSEFAGWYNEWGAWIVFIAGVTPFPYKVITIASGATGLDFIVFMLASIVARGLRFAVVAGLLYYFGPPIRAFIEKRLGLVFTLAVGLLLAGFVALKYL